ncbi:MAG: dTDP-4-dehydrorhamnose 3,5-epimerase [Acidobacteriota bacterium]
MAIEIQASREIPGLRLVRPDVFEDHRGRYVETWNVRDYRFLDLEGEEIVFVEDDISRSHAGVLRGLHGDGETWKLVQCLLGEIVLVVVDMRPDSPAFRRWLRFDLSAANRLQVLIPAGCANGHLALSDCLFSYKQSRHYGGAERQFTVRWNDPGLGIPWPVDRPILSERDASAPDLPPVPAGRLGGAT